ncbi:hypothetical protein IPZ60_13065 [Psychrobacter sp. NG25]|uniref:hypothetical protein n=1 Tax=Psychrobacter sp. NG25 TaxID=2782005 RepID=UPI001883B43E|nr:hypothetical protein [Psychrobacter sp. NG25]MBF0659675.1 hypothetical protein [Psychrobacter sp. NG25]
MKQILKHSFEAVSLLTTTNGMLDVTIVPAFNQPDWVIPSSLILSVDEYDEHISTYNWQEQEVAVFHLLPQNEVGDKIIVLEGNTSEHRLALQTAGELHQLQVRISDVKDIEVPENFDKTNINETAVPFNENVMLSYLFQTVMIEDKVYLIPDLDKIAHQLVDVSS